ncbi:MAG: DUF4365 domain-containing protein [Cetobacterium sp.]
MKINKKIQLGKVGFLYFERKVQSWDWLITKVQQEEDYGMDATVEISVEGILTGEIIGVQIKTGESYLDKKNGVAKFNIGNHYNYWRNHNLTMYGVVVDIDEECGYIVNITEYLKKMNKNTKNIKFYISDENNLNNPEIRNVIINNLRGKQVYKVTNTLERALTLEETIVKLQSKDKLEYEKGFENTLNYYYNELKILNILIEKLRDENDVDKLNEIVYLFSEMLSNPDIYRTRVFSGEILDKLLNEVKNYNEEMTIKLLNLIDDNGIARGTLGQAVETIVSQINSIDMKLLKILKNSKEDESFLKALVLLASYNPDLLMRKYNEEEEFRKMIELDDLYATIFQELIEYGSLPLY